MSNNASRAAQQTNKTAQEKRPPAKRAGAARRRMPAKNLFSASASLLAIAIAAPLSIGQAEAQKTMRGTELLENGVFRGANMPSVAAANNGFRMTIEQTEPKALIDWKKFNIHANDEVYFKQDSADWIALNRIFDANPTEIAGRITAKGQVWLMNTNGIVFTESARINVNTFVATQRPIAELDRYTTQELMARDPRTGDYAVDLIPGGFTNPGGDGAAFGEFIGSGVQSRYGVVSLPGMPADPGYTFADFDVIWNADSAFTESYSIADILAYYVIRKAAIAALGADAETRTGDLFNRGRESIDVSIDPRLEAFVPIAYLDALAQDFDTSVIVDNQVTYWFNGFRDGTIPGDDPVLAITDLISQGILPQEIFEQVSAGITDFARFRFSPEGREQIAAENAAYFARARVVIEEGAEIRTGRAVEGGERGNAIIVGTNVENRGRIEGDQVMLLAGERAYFEASTDQGLRGLVATVAADAPGALNDAFDRFYRGRAAEQIRFEVRTPVFRLDRAELVGMEVLNEGEIFAGKGNVSIVARNITNRGLIAASTGVSGENGSISLRASHDGIQFTVDGPASNPFGGEIVIEGDGEVRIDADDSGDTQLEGDVFRNSELSITGRRIELQSGAKVTAPGANVEIIASGGGRGGQFSNFVDARGEDTGLPQRGDDNPPPAVIVRDGATIDVSGLKDVEFDMDYNVVEIELRSNELADSPLYRDSFVTGEIVRVDRRVGTLFADWTAALNFTEVTAAQQMTAGGSLLLQAGGADPFSVPLTDGAVIIEQGSLIDISGGSRFFRTGTVEVTNFLQPDGRSVNIGAANPLQRYIGFADTPLRNLELGYTEGDNAGALEIKSPRALLLGDLDGSVIIGDNQRDLNLRALRALAPAGAVNTPADIVQPKWGSLTLGTLVNEEARLTFDYVYIVGENDEGAVVTQRDINGRAFEQVLTFDEAGIAQRFDDGLEARATAIVGEGFISGMGDTALRAPSPDEIRIFDGVEIETAPGGSFLIEVERQDAGSPGVVVGDNVSIAARGGRISLGRGAVFGDNILLDVSGEWINEAVDGRVNRAVFIDGGEIDFLQDRYEINGDITLDVSGGGWYRELSAPTRGGAGTYALEIGDGGSIEFQLPDFRQSDFEKFNIIAGGLGVMGDLILNIAGDLTIGNDIPGAPSVENNIDWYIRPDFFDRTAFSSYTLRAAGDVTVAAGTVLAPVHRSLGFGAARGEALTAPSPIEAFLRDLPSGARLADNGVYFDTPETSVRLGDFGFEAEFPQDPFSLSIIGSNSISVEAGALIDAGVLGGLNFTANYIDLFGGLTARGGNISLANNLSATEMPDGPAYIHIHDGAEINVDGVAQIQRVQTGPNNSARAGRVLDGGDISINAGVLLIDDNAQFNASGAAGVIDLPTIRRSGVLLRGAVDVASDGGAILIGGQTGNVLGQYAARPGGVGARGGRFSIGGGVSGSTPPEFVLLPDGRIVFGSVPDYVTSVIADYQREGLDSLLFDPLLGLVTADGRNTPEFLLQVLFTLQLLFGADVPTDLTPADLVQLDVDFRDPVALQAFMESVFLGRPEGASSGSLKLDATLGASGPGAAPGDFQSAAFDVFEIVVPEEFAGREEQFITTIELFFNVINPILTFGANVAIPEGVFVGTGASSLTFNPDRLIGGGIADLELNGGSRIELGSDVSIRTDATIDVAADVIDLNDFDLTLDTTYMRFERPVTGELGAAEAAGAGRFTASADLIEFNTIATFEGASQAAFDALEIRGRSPDSAPQIIPVGVDMLGTLTLGAGQIYPSTGQTLTFRSDTEINILPGRTGLRRTPLSAGGSLELTAPVINQGGYLSAPLGSITLNAVDTPDGPGTANFLEGSITSTAGNGLEILFGVTRDGVVWEDPRAQGLPFNDPQRFLGVSPEKRIAINADAININDNAFIDTSGGGDIRSFEFTPGIGGRTNYLDNGDGDVFAIVPAYGADIFAPFDPTYGASAGLDPADPDFDLAALGGDLAQAGRKIRLGGGFGLPAGDYILLPAAYALLDGAYRIRLNEQTPLFARSSTQSADGSFVTTGRLVTPLNNGASIESQTSFAVEVSGGDTIRQYSEYVEARGNAFFTSQDFVDNAVRQGIAVNPSPRRAADGGFLTLSARGDITLEGVLNSSGLDGARGGVVDIVSDNIAIVSEGVSTSDLGDFLILDVQDINNLGAESVLFGGVRRQSERGLEVRVGADQTGEAPITNPTRGDAVAADQVIVRTNANDPLAAPELLFVAVNDVIVESGSVILTGGGGVASGTDIILTPTVPEAVIEQGGNIVPDPTRPAENFSAFLRLSSIDHVNVIRDNAVANEFGNLLIGENVAFGGVDGSAQSLILNATGNLEVGDGAALRADVIAAATTFIAAGEFPADLSGVAGYADAGGEVRGVLRLTPQTLALLGQSGALDLQAFQSIDFFGDAEIALDGADTSITLTTPMIRGATGDANALLRAEDITLRSIDALSDARRTELEAGAVGGGGSLLTLQSDRLTFADTARLDGQAFGLDLLGFELVDATVADTLVFTGEGGVRIGGGATIAAPRVVTQRTTQYDLTAAGDLAFTSLARNGDSEIEAGVGGVLRATGGNLRLDTTFELPSGVLVARAPEGDLTAGANARILTGGAEAQFFELTESLPGGEARFIADNGDVIFEQGSLIDVSGGADGGEGGRLVASSGAGTAIFNGELEGDGGGGEDGASVIIDVARLDNFGALADRLNAAGFNGDRSFALGASDVVIDGTTRARSFRLVTSAGDVTVAGAALIETGGGDIAIFSAGDLDVLAGARLDASARGAEEEGGDITLGLGADAASRMSLAAGASLDVSGADDGAAGEIRLRALQIGDDDVAIANADADFIGAPALVEAYAVTDLAVTDGVAEIDADSIATGEVRAALDAAAAFMANAGAIEARLGGGVTVTPGVELRSAGDILLSANWNLRTERYDGQAGALALRATGDITLDGNLSDGFLDAARTPDIFASEAEIAGSKLTNDLSWSYVIAAGANQAAADPSAVSAIGGGDLTVNGLVRTGTGDITLTAAGNIVLGTEEAAVYTIGVEAAEVENFARTSLWNNRQFSQADAYFYQLFTEGGGDVTLNAGGDIIGHESTNIYAIRDWLWSRGAIAPESIQIGGSTRLIPESFLPDALFAFDEDNNNFWQTAIWLMPDEFNGGIATMGGGDITARAGGDADNVNLYAARTLRISGGTPDTPQKTAHFGGGGDVSLTTGGSIRGGGVYVSEGRSSIIAGGAVERSTRTNRSLVLSVGDAQARVRASADARVDSIFTPFIELGQRQDAGDTTPQRFIEYTRDSAVRIFSSGGDAALIGNPLLRELGPNNYYDAPFLETFEYYFSDRSRIIPGQITLAAPNGGARIGAPVINRNQGDAGDGVRSGASPILDAHENTALTILARDTIENGDVFIAPFRGATFLNSVTIGDLEYDLAPRLFNPLSGAGAVGFRYTAGLPASGAIGPDGAFDNTNARNRLYSTEGDIIVSGQTRDDAFSSSSFASFALTFSNETWIKAAGDFIGSVNFQNNNELDLSLIQTGGDIRGFEGNASNFIFSGPGRFEIRAGGDAFIGAMRAREFGADGGLGFDFALNANAELLERIDDGDILLMTGINQAPNYQEFADLYFNPALVDNPDTPDYLIRESEGGAVPFWSDLLIAWAEKRSGESGLSVEGAYAVYEATAPEYRTELIMDVFEAEIRISGREAVGASPGSDPAGLRLDDPRRGYIAINRLFPGAGRPTQARFDELSAEAQAGLLEAGLGPITDELLAAGESLWQGELVGVSPLIRTEGENGPGDIQILSPGDNLRLTLPSVESTSSDDAGVITEDGGDIFTFARGDLITGQSRIITANGGDILVWSSYGGVDAGAGAKTTLSIPPVLFETDRFGVTIIDRDNPIDGAGVATLFDLNGDPGGDIDLYAFNGTVNAGDAGIRASRDLFVGAVEIRGLDNITVGGVTNVDLQVETGEIGPLNLEDFAEAAAERALDEALESVEAVESARSRGRITSELLGLDGCIDEDGDGIDDETGDEC